MKLKSVLLIDDDHMTNVFHTVVLKRTQVAEQIVTMETPEIALEHLQKASKVAKEGASFGQMTMPELIFLDVNMPRMTGFEFLREFEKVHSKLGAQSVVYMLTAAYLPQEHDKFLIFDFVKGVLQKPLTKEKISEIVETHFQQEII